MLSFRRFVLLPLLSMLCIGCAIPPTVKPVTMVWKSRPMGDLVVDMRKPADVCQQILREDTALRSCALVESKSSNKEEECVDGMSIAGCFACRFSCP